MRLVLVKLGLVWICLEIIGWSVYFSVYILIVNLVRYVLFGEVVLYLLWCLVF